MIEILNNGLYSSLQDLGRSTSSHLGIPLSGAMDSYSAELANMILTNEQNAAVIECTVIGPKLKFLKATTIAITGAIIQPFVNNQPVNINCALRIEEDDILSFGRIVKGARFYIAVAGGFEGVLIMGSRSACITSNILSILKKGETISYQSQRVNSSIEIQAKPIGQKIIDAYCGPEYKMLVNELAVLDKINKTFFLVEPSSNRMAYRVKHDLDLSHKMSIISSGVLPGTVQLTPSGELIFLMRDAQTTGGYPRVLQLTEEGICAMAQLKAGDKFEVRTV